MDIGWLEKQDADFHKRLYQLLAAKAKACSDFGFAGYARLVQTQMDWLMGFGKIPKNEAASIHGNTAAELSYFNQAWEQFKEKAGEFPKKA